MLSILFPITFMVSSLLLLSYLIWIRPEAYLRSWTSAWAVLSLMLTLSAVHASGPRAAVVIGLLNLLMLALLLRGAQLLHEQHPIWLWVTWALPLAVLGLYLRVAGANFGDLSGAVALALAAATILLLIRRGHGSVGQWVLALALAGWALACVSGVPVFETGLIGVFCGFCGSGILAVACEQERDVTERNLRDLSTVDLSSQRGIDKGDQGEILTVLVARLARMLQAPKVLLWTDRAVGAVSEQSVGFSPDFNRYLLEHGSALTALSTRYSGLVVGRNPPAKRASDALGGAELAELRRRLAGEGASVFVLSLLQCKSQLNGLLLVARKRRRNFLPGELRLLLVVSAHAAMALENLHLFRKMMRRTREFQTLTEIGTALSSALEVESLLGVIYAELQKLMDVRNFYVAFQDTERDEIRFMLEIEDGRVLPRRQRPRTHGLTEHVIATGRSLLISRDPAAYVELHGLTGNGRPARTWMGVPLVLKGRPEGVIALQDYEKSDAYDADHLHMIEIVASQAATAIENARLFEAVQRDVRHRDFLAQAARVTISALRTPEVLSTVTDEITKVFQFDHVAIGIIRGDELEFRPHSQADTGRTSFTGTLALGHGLAGQAALSSQMIWTPDVTADPHAVPLHPGSRSVLAVPINFDKDTLGVLVLECDAPHAFTREQVQVMQTLADQLAAALDRSRSYERAELQAVTDSLTRLKTRRFFMESLEDQLSRAPTGDARFAIVMADLDDFKRVNDTLGHLEGDRVIERVARLFDSRCRISSIAARYGGDEFTILVPGCGMAEGQRLVARLREALAEDPLLVERKIEASFGVAAYPDSGVTAEELMRAADVAMYADKLVRGGDNRAAAHGFRIHRS